MSYIRATADGQYIDIPGGSNYYIYDDGSSISGWTEEEFAALIGEVAYEIDISESVAAEIGHEFEQHFGGWDDDYRGGITPPERAEIFCQCVDKRIDAPIFTDTLHEAVKRWANDFDAMRSCDNCGEEFRPRIYNDDTSYFCQKEECEKAFNESL